MIKKTNFKQTSFSIILILFSIQLVNAVEIRTNVDRNPVNINESFQLTFTANESPDEEPDFKPLNKNFEILSNKKSSNSSWINGKSTKSIQWVLNVMAKNTGDIVIPAIFFGDDVSESIVLSVTKSNASGQNDQQNELFLEVEATPSKVYVQSQVLYTLKFYFSVQIAQASLTEPEMADALVEKLGEDKNYKTNVNGIAYMVTERKYAIFPQKSGKLTIEPLILTADVVSQLAPRFNGFFRQQMTKTKRVTSKAITLDVQAAPGDFTGKHWIPAEQVYIEESWSGDINNMKIGEPLTRTISLLAKGTTVAQLPELHNEADIPQLKSYPDQPVLKEKKQADGLIALREEKIAYIPSKAGSFTLPEIKVPWFNTQTKKMQVAAIPAKKITVVAAAEGQTEPTPTNTEPRLEEKNTETVKTVETIANPFWMWLAIFFASVWLITLFFLVKKPKQQIDDIAENSTELKIKDVVKVLKKACQEDDKSATKEALLAWGEIKYNQHSLSSIANQCGAELKDEIEGLNQRLYASQSESWQGENLFKAFIAENKAKDKDTVCTDELEPLYKV